MTIDQNLVAVQVDPFLSMLVLRRESFFDHQNELIFKTAILYIDTFYCSNKGAICFKRHKKFKK